MNQKSAKSKKAYRLFLIMLLIIFTVTGMINIANVTNFGVLSENTENTSKTNISSTLASMSGGDSGGIHKKTDIFNPITGNPTVRVKQTANGTISVDVISNIVTVTATPNKNYEVDKVYYNDGSDHEVAKNSRGTYIFVLINRSVTVRAVFKLKGYETGNGSVKVLDSENGSLKVDVASNIVTVTATPDEFYEVDKVYYNDGSDHEIVKNRYGTYMFALTNRKVTVKATFKPKEYELVYDKLDGGTITGPLKARYKDIVTLNANTYKDYIFEKITVYDANQNPIEITNGSFVMPPSNVTVSAIYIENKISINQTPQTFTYGDSNIKFSIRDSEYNDFNVEYSKNGIWTSIAPNDAGNYDVRVTRNEDDLHNAFNVVIDDGLVIKKADYDMSNITFANSSKVYNGTEQGIVIGGTLPTGKDGKKVTVSYSAGQTDVGTKKITATFATTSNNYNVPTAKTATITITKADYDMSNITFANSSKVYNGTEQGIVIGGTLPTGKDGKKVTVSYSLGQIDVGTKTITATFATTSNNYNVPTAKTATITITKADYDMSNITFANSSKVYNGTEQGIVIGGTLPTGKDGKKVTVSYSLGQIDVGTKTITATFATTSNNYNVPTAKTATITITKADYDMSNITFANSSKVYNGTEQGIVIGGTLPTGKDGKKVTVSYSAGQTDVGTKTITATFATTSNNYNVPTAKTATITITKADYDMSNITFANSSKVYNGTEQGIVIGGTLPTGKDGKKVTVSYSAGQTDVGTKTITATFATTSNNYNVPTAKTATITITKADYDMSNITFANSSKVYNGTEQGIVIGGTLPTGKDGKNVTVSYSAGQTDVGTKTITATFATTSNNYNVPTAKTATITITKAEVNVVAPKANTGLVYTGAKQALVFDTNASGGQIQYKLGKNGQYSTNIPTVTEPGEYQVYYKIVGDKNHSNSTESYITVSVQAADNFKISDETAAKAIVKDPNGGYSVTGKYADNTKYDTIEEAMAAAKLSVGKSMADDVVSSFEDELNKIGSTEIDTQEIIEEIISGIKHTKNGFEINGKVFATLEEALEYAVKMAEEKVLDVKKDVLVDEISNLQHACDGKSISTVIDYAGLNVSNVTLLDVSQMSDIFDSALASVRLEKAKQSLIQKMNADWETLYQNLNYTENSLNSLKKLMTKIPDKLVKCKTKDDISVYSNKWENQKTLLCEYERQYENCKIYCAQGIPVNAKVIITNIGINDSYKQILKRCAEVKDYNLCSAYNVSIDNISNMEVCEYKVSISLGNDYSVKSRYKVIFITGDNETKVLDAKCDLDGNLTFTTTELGDYVIVKTDNPSLLLGFIPLAIFIMIGIGIHYIDGKKSKKSGDK